MSNVIDIIIVTLIEFGIFY